MLQSVSSLRSKASGLLSVASLSSTLSSVLGNLAPRTASKAPSVMSSLARATATQETPTEATPPPPPVYRRRHVGYICRETYKAPRNPIVLCHGPDTIPALQIHYWRGIVDALQDLGCEVHIPRVGTVSSIQMRAKELDTFLRERLKGQSVNLIAHSMGGLDARYLITHLKPQDYRIHSLTTIATPHRGSGFMDWLRESLGVGRLDPSTHDEVTQALWREYTQGRAPSPTHLSRWMSTQEMGQEGPGAHPVVQAVFSRLDAPAFANLTSEYCQAYFNPATPNDPRVSYFSYGAAMSIPQWAPLYLPQQAMLKQGCGPNDGLVALESAVWGRFMGTLDCDHWDIVPSKMRPRRRGKFDYVSFYLGVSTHLWDCGY